VEALKASSSPPTAARLGRLQMGPGVNVLNLTHAGRIALAMAPSSPMTLYAGIANVNTGNLLGFFQDH